MNYSGRELRFIKDYGEWILFENELGIREGIHKHDLGLIKERVSPPKSYLKPEKVVYIRRRHR